MAFNMKRPIIKGTVLHKTSIALAKKKSIVTPASVGADKALIQASNWLGESNVGQAVDFKIDQSQRKLPKDFNKGKKKKKKKGKSKSDYGTYEEYLAEDSKLQKSMDDKAYEAYLDEESGTGVADANLPSRDDWEKNLRRPYEPSLSKIEWTDLNVEAGMKKPKGYKNPKQRERIANRGTKDTWYRDSNDDGTVISRTLDKIKIAIENAKTKKEKKVLENKQEELLKIESLRIKPLPTEKDPDDKLVKASEYVPKTTADTDRFVDAAEERGYDMSTQEGWEAAEYNAKYDEEKDEWVFGGVEVGKLTTEDDQELLKVIEEENKKRKAEKLAKKKALKKEAKEFYNEHGEKLNQKSFDEYLKMKKEGTLDEYGHLEIVEEDDPEPGDAGYEKFLEEEKKREFINKDDNNNNIPDYLEVEPYQKTRIQREMDGFEISDLERDKSGGPFEQERNDRIWGYAKQGGPLQQNMRKSGYIPREER